LLIYAYICRCNLTGLFNYLDIEIEWTRRFEAGKIYEKGIASIGLINLSYFGNGILLQHFIQSSTSPFNQ
jgi:hypothetical protein